MNTLLHFIHTVVTKKVFPNSKCLTLYTVQWSKEAQKIQSQTLGKTAIKNYHFRKADRRILMKHQSWEDKEIRSELRGKEKIKAHTI